MAKPDGGPAFPDSTAVDSSGMSLRDYFAGQALTGAFTGGDTEIHDDIMARRCYQIADAMLAEREKE